MQTGENYYAFDFGLPESPLDRSPPSGGFRLPTKLEDKLEKLAKWRIDPSSVEFPEDSREFRGGYATVAKAFLGPPSGKDRKDRSDAPKGKSLDPYGSEGGTSRRLKDVAVKKMNISGDPTRILGLTLREAEFLIDLSHENVIKLEGFVENMSNDVIWLVFPWEENGTLRDFIASADWEIPERISLIDDMARGVEYLHGRQPPIYHGDLKSLNILVNPAYRAVITDFGSAQRVATNDLHKETRQTEHGLMLETMFCASTNTISITLTGPRYTLRWAAPELLSDREPSLGSDIWAFGWVVYEVMTNSIPFQDVKDTIVIHRVIRGDLPSLTGDARMTLVQELCSLMLACWSMVPEIRPTAKDCQMRISWMPMIIPNPIRTAARSLSPALLMRVGDMYRRQSDYPNALDLFTGALNGYSNIGDTGEGKAAALVQLAQIHRLQHKYSQAISLHSEALHILTDIGDSRGRADALWGLAEVHRLQDQYSEAVTLYSEALQTFTDLGDRQGRADALWGLAEAHQSRDEYSQAATFYSESLQIHTDIGDRQGRANALSGLAEVYRAQYKYSEAVSFYSEALQIRTDVGDRQGRANALWGLAEVHRAQNQYSQAVTLYSEALQIRTDIDDRRGRADALLGLAEVHRAQNEYSQAVTLYSEDLQIRTDIGDRQGRAQTLRCLAEVYRLQNQYSQAMALNSEALEICTDIGDQYGRAYTLVNLAVIHHNQGDYSGATRRYEEAAEVFKQFGDTHNAAYAADQAATVHQSSRQEGAT